MSVQISCPCFACGEAMLLDKAEVDAPDGIVLVDDEPVPYYCCSKSCRLEVAALIASHLVVDPELLNEASNATNSEIVHRFVDDRELTEGEETDLFLKNYRNLMAERSTRGDEDQE